MQIDNVDGTDCSYTFGNAYVDDGTTGINYGDTLPPPDATSVPTMSIYVLLLTTLGLLLLGARHMRRLGKLD